MSVIEARTSSIASHLHQADQLTGLSTAVHLVQSQTQEAIAQQTNIVASMQSMVQGLVAATQASPAAVPGRAPVPHPFTPAFNGDAKNLSFRAYKAKLNG
ncbi:hypothetical protein BGX31_006432, partial [Mortierella sp. GBA43]